jgi:peptidoglycan biosynthesis protein MviN/MurJ (putative lipid II flippase)
VAGSFVKVAIASAVMGAAALAVEALARRWLPGGALVFQIARLTVAIAVALGVLAAAAHLLHIREFREGMAMVTRRFRR